jgi:Protein of unknown function (DUF2281)
LSHGGIEELKYFHASKKQGVYNMNVATDTLKQQLLEKVTDLSEARLQEVLDFIDFLRLREQTNEDPILRVAGCLSGTPLSSETIDEELYGKEPT